MALRKHLHIVASLTAGLVLGATAVAVAQIPDSNTKVISACVDRRGSIRVIDYQAGRRCSRSETFLTWNQQGVAGQPGAQGPAGQPGETGPAGPSGTASRSVEFIGASLKPTFTRTISEVPPGTYLILLEAFIGGGTADCWSSISPTNWVYSGGKYLGQYSGSGDNATRSFRIMRLEETGSISIECEAVSAFANTIDGVFSIVPLS